MSEISAHQDEQQNFSIIGVQGTLGTADTKGTALTLPIGVNPTNGAVYVNPISLLPTQNTNGSVVLGYDGSGNLTTITKTIGATSYVKTLTYDASNVLTDISAWV